MSRFMRLAKMTGLGTLGLVAYCSDRFNMPEIRAESRPRTFPTEKRKWDSNWDFREGLENGQDTKLAKRFIILIRHGQYHTDGKTESEMKLTELGREQARMTGQRLKELGIRYTKLIHSPMTRARETAEIIHEFIPDVPTEECPLLEEGSPIEPEPPSKTWRPPHYYHQDGARIEAAFRKYFHRASPHQEKDTYEIIVCHANVIRYFVCRALQIPPEAWLRFSLRHASMTSIIIYDGGKVSLRSFGDAGYMPPHTITTS
ncbi:serine/threonine-protein phosphatase PGAM5, mitochondrial isoform X2 [Cimex lectularius]|uniref:Serine/threonine-protein phosphatase PGAM5, mitochondrial n=1 Tax=Cimex lectularius TaxID=79782 RepID=A0A8I6SK36_CIMLE|nr:serine/threonine-protein phosphatase PGAM5, mitochondrial isoform X2 [Cimex lectularius]